jgi:hypothetical protein
MHIVDSSIDNRICRHCGFVWNQGGPSGRTPDFYANQYQLRMHAADAQNFSFVGDQPAPIAQVVLDYLISKSGLASRGRLLEVGAGRGEIPQPICAAAARLAHGSN